MACALCLAAAWPAAAAEVRAVESAVEGEQVLLSFSLEGAFDDPLVARLESGLPTEIRYRFLLQRDRKRWFDADLDEATLTVVAMYDALRREYLVNVKLDGKLLESRTVEKLDELARVMTRVERLPVFSLRPSSDRRRLLVRVRAELGHKNLLGFIPTQITSDWVESPKFRRPAEPPP